MLSELKKLAGGFSARPLSRGREMRDLLEFSPADFCAAAVEILGGEETERVKRYLLAMLWTNNLLIPCLKNPSTPLKMAEAIAGLARRMYPQLSAQLVSYVLDRTDSEAPECLEQILSLLKSMPDAATFRPLLTPLLRHHDARIRSKVALLAGEGNRNRTWFERRMLEDDPRVRANAIESAGTAVAKDLRPLFRSAAFDANNRVVGNALIALYRLGDAGAVASLYDLIFRTEPAFRATAAWAMGETGDTRFLPVLAKVLTDPNETIKSATFRAIRKLRTKDNANAAPVDVRILGEPSLDGCTWKILFGVWDQDKSVLALPATAARILVNGENVYRYSTTEQTSARRIAAAFLLPRVADLNGERRENYRLSLERCLEQRRPGDRWLLSQHSGYADMRAAARPETIFGVRIDCTETNAVRAIRGREELRAALDSGESNKNQDFKSRFLDLCRALRPSRVSGHLFLIDPEFAPLTETETLTQAAQEAHISVHAICKSSDARVRQLSQATGGFYATGNDLTDLLPALYRGLSQRYEASVTGDVEVRSLQIAVSSSDFFGESPILTMNG